MLCFCEKTRLFFTRPDIAARNEDEILPVRHPLSTTLIWRDLPPRKELMRILPVRRNLPNSRGEVKQVSDGKSDHQTVWRPRRGGYPITGAGEQSPWGRAVTLRD